MTPGGESVNLTQAIVFCELAKLQGYQPIIMRLGNVETQEVQRIIIVLLGLN